LQKSETALNFDPNAPAPEGAGIFGLPCTEAEASLVLIPVPWEATTSYGSGAALGPSAILAASKQVDLYDLDVEMPYRAGIFMLAESAAIGDCNTRSKVAAREVIENYEHLDASRRAALLEQVRTDSETVNAWVAEETRRLRAAGKIACVVGGDHSVPLGAFLAVAETESAFGILHIDAHSDTREAYEGFRFSHASIMHNALTQIPQVKKLVQVGIRDVCEQEMRFVSDLGSRAQVFFDRSLRHRLFRGESWQKICAEIVDALPQKVWISFDIDGLDPRFCPHTGTPVPGGLDFQEMVFLLHELVRSGRCIIGFDLSEVAANAPPEAADHDPWDGNVGARMLYKLAGHTLASHGKAKLLA
jgi:agmatinase